MQVREKDLMCKKLGYTVGNTQAFAPDVGQWEAGGGGDVTISTAQSLPLMSDGLSHTLTPFNLRNRPMSSHGYSEVQTDQTSGL